MSAAILGIGTAVPDGTATQAEAAAFARTTIGGDENSARAVEVLYRRSGVERRGTVLAAADGGGQSFFQPAAHGEDRGPGTAARMSRYATEAPYLAARAARTALDAAHVSPGHITHLVTASCTGFAAPGFDLSLIDVIGLPREVQRAHIGFMGCHAAINALRVAEAFARDPSATVLVCACEICSLHYQYGGDPDMMVANALFADGAAGAVVGAGAGLRLRGFGSVVVPESADAMGWCIGDHGFEMMLSARVPELLRASARPWVAEWLARHELGIDDVGCWCVHPGGPRILGAVAEGLGLAEGAMAASRAVLAEHGNMSSPTVLFILERLRRLGSIRDDAPCVMLAFGPGLVIEAALIG